MSKSTGNKVSVENWNVSDPSNKFGNKRAVVTKVAVRAPNGQFHGATNFKGSVLGK